MIGRRVVFRGAAVLLAALVILFVYLRFNSGPETAQTIQTLDTRDIYAINTITGLGEAPQGTGGPAAQSAAPARIIHLNCPAEPDNLDPAFADSSSSWILEHIMEGLYRIGPDGSAAPALAEKCDISGDGLTYTFTIRDAKWSNGDAVTAQDFAAAWQSRLGMGPAPDSNLKLLRCVAGVRAGDDGKLTVELSAPVPYFPVLLANPVFFPADSKRPEAKLIPGRDTYVTCGPFVPVKWQKGGALSTVKNQQYYNKDAVKPDGADWTFESDGEKAWRMYKAGALDMLYPLPPAAYDELKAADSAELFEGRGLAVYYYILNTSAKPLDNQHIRQALNLSVDRAKIIQNAPLGGAQPAYGLTPPGVYTPNGDYRQVLGNLFGYDPVQAKKLLEQGLDEEKLSAFPNGFTILYNAGPAHKALAQAICGMWKANLGIDIAPVEESAGDAETATEHSDFQIARSGWSSDIPDAASFLSPFTSANALNHTGWGMAKFDGLINAASAEMDAAARAGALQSAERFLIDQSPVIPIYFYTRPYAQKAHIAGAYQPAGQNPVYIYAALTK